MLRRKILHRDKAIRCAEDNRLAKRRHNQQFSQKDAQLVNLVGVRQCNKLVNPTAFNPDNAINSRAPSSRPEADLYPAPTGEIARAMIVPLPHPSKFRCILETRP
jgi:hypothetical protein